MDTLSDIYTAAWALRVHIGIVVLAAAIGLHEISLRRKLAAARNRIHALEQGVGLVAAHMRARLEAHRSRAR